VNHMLALAGLIEAANLGTRGVDLFVGTMDANIASGVMLRGSHAGNDANQDIPGLFTTTVQVIVRDKNPATGYSRATAIARAIRMREVDVDGLHFFYVLPRHLPIQYPRDQGGLIESSINYDICFGDTSNPLGA